ncbi:hypothetical protein ACJJTC_011458 [Scirpophaga incertulas]
MARCKVKWTVCFCYWIGIASIIHTLPLDKKVQHRLISESDKDSDLNSEPKTLTKEPDHVNSVVNVVHSVSGESISSVVKDGTTDLERVLTPRNQLRPGLVISEYEVELTINENTFQGREIFRASVTSETRNDTLLLHVSGLTIQSVLTGSTTIESANPATFRVIDGERLEIRPSRVLSNYIVLIEYSGTLGNNGEGLYRGVNNYIGMNLSPTNARRVFPCIDELTESPRISIAFNGIEYENLQANSVAEDDEPSNFKVLQGIPNRFAFIGNNFQIYTRTQNNICILGRPEITGQENLAAVAISSFYDTLNAWTNKNYFQILLNQASEMHVIALPDVDVEWNSLSIVGVWEPYMMMETQHAVKQRQIGLMKIAEAMARPWFGYTLSPANWKYEWITSGLMTYVAYEAAKQFQSDSERALDYQTLFITEVFQESLYHDCYTTTDILEPNNEIFNENDIRGYLNGPMKFKAPSILHMLRHTIDKDVDFIQDAARGLFISSGLETISSTNFIDILADHANTDMVSDIVNFVNPYIKQKGCPLLSVNVQGSTVTISRSAFSFGGTSDVNYNLPITLTSEANPDFNEVFPSIIYNSPTTLNLQVDVNDEQWVLFNIQGHGYYRVQYNGDMWERILNALNDPDRRNVIHPLNRATLLDDALNLARMINSGLDYDIALRIVLAMSLETEYAPWKAYIRNMNFLKKHLDAMVESDDDLDPEVYTRFIQKTVNAVETELSFSPNIDVMEPPMTTLTRAMVMDHACRAGYDVCIAAAIDWFYSSEEGINPNIPKDLKPAVYCAVVKDGGGEVREQLIDLMQDGEKTKSMYDRLVILEALACSRDDNFIKGYLDETISGNSPYSIEERNRIFTAIVESSFRNAKTALTFLRSNTNQIRDSYGGSRRLEQLIFLIADNVVHSDMIIEFQTWVDSGNNNLSGSSNAAKKAIERARENLDWNAKHLSTVYEWIEENDAATASLSMLLIVLLALLNILY